MSFALPGSVAHRLLSYMRKLDSQALVMMSADQVVMQIADMSHVIVTFVHIDCDGCPRWTNPTSTQTHMMPLRYGERLLDSSAHLVEFVLPHEREPDHFVLRSLDQNSRELMVAKFNALNQGDAEMFSLEVDPDVLLRAKFATASLHDVVAQAKQLEVDWLEIQSDGHSVFSLRGESQHCSPEFKFFTTEMGAMPVARDEPDGEAAANGRKRASPTDNKPPPQKRAITKADGRVVARLLVDADRYKHPERIKVQKMLQATEVDGFCLQTILEVVAFNGMSVARFTSRPEAADYVKLTSHVAFSMRDDE